MLSTFSYLVDYFHLHGMLRWTLIILFMLLKAGFIVADLHAHGVGAAGAQATRSWCRRCACWS